MFKFFNILKGKRTGRRGAIGVKGHAVREQHVTASRDFGAVNKHGKFSHQ